MSKLVERYRRNADKCLQLVQNFSDPEAKRALLVMANAWLMLAAQREKDKSLNRPEGNLTDVSLLSGKLEPKRLELLRELLPATKLVAVLVNPANSTAEAITKDVQSAASSLGLQLRVVTATTGGEIDEAFATIGRQRPDALSVAPDIVFNTRRVQIAILAAHYSIPTAFAARDYVDAGGLLSYGTNPNDAYRQVGVLKGEEPTDLPVLQATKFELVINLRTARALGLTVPDSLLARADEVIE